MRLNLFNPMSYVKLGNQVSKYNLRHPNNQKRFASALFGKVKNQALPRSRKEFAQQAAFDLIAGGFYGSMAEGDAGDKLLTGLGIAGGGIGGSHVLRGITGATRGPGFYVTEMGGQLMGDQIAMPLVNKAQQMKDSISGGEGLSPWEKMEKENYEAMLAQAKMEIMQQYGLGRLSTTDPMMMNNGLS